MENISLPSLCLLLSPVFEARDPGIPYHKLQFCSVIFPGNTHSTLAPSLQPSLFSPDFQGWCPVHILEFTMPRQETLSDFVSLKSHWSPDAPSVYNFISFPPLPYSSWLFLKGTGFWTRSAELAMSAMWGCRRMGKATVAKLQAKVILIRSAQLLSLSFA